MGNESCIFFLLLCCSAAPSHRLLQCYTRCRGSSNTLGRIHGAQPNSAPGCQMPESWPKVNSARTRAIEPASGGHCQTLPVNAVAMIQTHHKFCSLECIICCFTTIISMVYNLKDILPEFVIFIISFLMISGEKNWLPFLLLYISWKLRHTIYLFKNSFCCYFHI